MDKRLIELDCLFLSLLASGNPYMAAFDFHAKVVPGVGKDWIRQRLCRNLVPAMIRNSKDERLKQQPVPSGIGDAITTRVRRSCSGVFFR
jgi:hypothetical protein